MGKLYEETCKYMLDCLEGSARDMMHVRRVLSYALEIADKRGDVDTDVIVLAALLHDIGKPRERDYPCLSHAESGSRMAFDFLSSRGFERPGHVAVCIASHNMYSGLEPVTLEAEILFDANQLDLTGAMGTVRWLISFAGEERPVYCTDGEGMPLCGVDEEPSLFRLYEGTLRDLHRVFHTDEARRIATDNRRAMDVFFEDLHFEVERSHLCERILLEKQGCM